MTNPNVCVLNAPGINCNIETAEAFKLAGARTEQVHISQLRSGERRLSNYQILALSGGFSHGDDLGSGRVLGLELRTQLRDQVSEFADIGGVVIGICNGFQTLVESSLLTEGKTGLDAPKTASLIHNKDGGFQCRWSRLRVEQSKCAFAQPDMLGEIIELPVAHGEGQFLMKGVEAYQQLEENEQMVFRYIDEDGWATTEFPNNPNGSPYGITGVCDPTGRILGMMPHPERFVRPEQYINYHRAKALGETVTPHGLPLFESMVKYAKES